MRSIWRTLPPGLGRSILLVCLADTVVGISFAAIAVGFGLPVWLPMLLSVVVFAGASQFVFVGLVASGGNPVAAVLACLLINTRHLTFGFTVADAVGDSVPRKLLGSYLMIDEAVAFTMAQQDSAHRRAAYWCCGSALFVFWNIGVLFGAFGGTFVSDTDALGLDAAFPAVLLALVLPQLNDGRVRAAGAVGAVIAMAAAPLLPAGLPVVLALVGVLLLRRNDSRIRESAR